MHLSAFIRLSIYIFVLSSTLLFAQSQFGTVRGVLLDPAGAAVPNADVEIANSYTGYFAAGKTGLDGTFSFNNVPLGSYKITARANGFRQQSQPIAVRSNVPIEEKLRLSIAGTQATVDIAADLNDPSETRTESKISSNRLAVLPNVTGNQALARTIAMLTGATTQNNGLMHIRGVEDGVLYVMDGVPTTDRVDSVSASSFDIGTIRSVQVITGDFPAEFGGRSGAVVQMQSRSGIDESLRGELSAAGGNFGLADVDGAIAWGWKKKIGIFASGSANRTDRYLDPVDERNFNNRGSRRSFNSRVDWHPSRNDFLFFDLGLNDSNFRVPNDHIQELAGQRQSQRLRDGAQSLFWQKAWNSSTVTNLVLFRRAYKSRLLPSEFDIPIQAFQDRRHVRKGMIGSVSVFAHGHSIKSGVEATDISVRELFTFAVTDEDLAEEREVSDAVREFTSDRPFVFKDSRRGSYAAVYAQDEFSPFPNFTVSGGLRYERSTLPGIEQQLSPRLGIAYFIPRTQTVIRASFNRLYQPPQLENLLLSESEQARQLSPFAGDGLVGGARVRAERISAYELGAAQKLWDLGRLDVAFWHRDFRNFGDPNTFFNTTIIFPNSVDHGFSRGIDVRLEIAEKRGFSGFASYSNGRIVQTGPVNGGLFLTDDFVEIGPGTRFIPDHDQRNVATFAVMYSRRGLWTVSLSGRHESGVPLEVEEERLEELRSAPGSDLVNFERGRVRPWTIFDAQVGLTLRESKSYKARFEFNVQNIFNSRFAYNFGSPFEGTHFGYPRMIAARLTVNF